MARSNTGSTSNWFENSSAALTGVPISIACWFNVASAVITYNLCLISNSSVSNYFGLDLSNGAPANGTVGALTAIAGEAFAKSTTTFSASSWNHACAVFDSITSRSAFLNGGGKGTNATSKTPASLAKTTVGAARSTTTTFSPINGSIAEVAIWSAALDDAEVASLATGICPRLIRPSSLTAYWPLIGRFSPELDFGNNGVFPLTMNGTMAQADHTRIFYKRHKNASGAAAAVLNPYDLAHSPQHQAMVAM